MNSQDRLSNLREKLADAETELSALVDAADGLACLMAKDGRLERLSPAWEARFGRTAVETLGQPLATFVHPEDADATNAALAALNGSGTDTRFENRLSDSEGQYHRMAWTISPLNQGLAYGIATEIATAASTEVSDEPTSFVDLVESVAMSAVQTLGTGGIRRLAERSAQIYRSLVGTSPNALMILSKSGRILLCNEQGAVVHGFDDQEEMIGRNAFEYIAEEDRQRGKEHALAALEAGGVSSITVTLLRSDGTRFPGEISASTMPDTEGQPRAIIMFVRDLTEAKQTEEALRQAEELYRGIVETSPDAITVTDLSARAVFFNEQALKMHGFDGSHQAVGQMTFDLIAPEDRERAMEYARTTLETGSIHDVQYTLLRKDGTQFPAELSASVIRDANGNPQGFVGVVRDISERKRAQEELRRSEERYRALYQDNPTMYFTVDAEGTVLSVNQYGVEQLGYAASELVGKSVLGVFYEADKKDVSAQLASCLAKPGEIVHWEFRKVRKDGQIIWVEEAARATRDIDGNQIVLIVCEDITEMKRMEEELQQAREELERRVERQMQRDDTYGLTFRELTVLHLVADGKSDKEIGITLGISPLTVSKHVANILGKMGAASRSEASARAVREALVD